MLPPGVLSQQRHQGESSATIRERVLIARQIQLKRANKINALLTSREIEQHCALEAPDAAYLEEVMNKLGLSVRAWHRILKVARTIADLGDRDSIERKHLAEALSYRSMD
nr:hypothetical protein PJ912_11340 [Pectobacterium colocasium]